MAKKLSERVEKHCRKWRNCLLLAISPFPNVFSKDSYCKYVKQGLSLERVKACDYGLLTTTTLL